MPRVPVVDTQQVGIGSMPTPRFGFGEAPVVQDLASRQIAQQSEAMTRAGTAATIIAADMQAQANRARTDDFTNELVKADTDLRIEATQLRGRNALERPDGKPLTDEFAERLERRARELEGGLGNDFQKAQARQITTQMANRLRSALGQHLVQEQRTYENETDAATIATAVDRGTRLWGDEQERVAAHGAIRATIDRRAAREGWDEATKQDALLKATSPLHAGVIQSMIAGGLSRQARAYYEANSAEMTMQARVQMQGVVKEASDAQVAEDAAGAAWSKLGPQGPNDAIRQADMEAAIREQLKDNPNAMKAAIDGLRQRSQAHNAQQTELKAANESGVWKLLDAGKSWAEVQRSPAWLAMTDTERRAIRMARDAELYQQESRAAARASRAASEAQRSLAEQQRTLTGMKIEDELRFRENAADYATMMDPDVLTSMSRAQIEASRTKFGVERTLAALERYDALKKRPEKIVEARMDREDFVTVAAEMGLKPNDDSKSPADKDKLAFLQSRLERLIDRQQSQTGKPMTREEKMTLMRRELAASVTVDNWYSRERKVPVIQLTASEIKDVQVPDEDRKQIIEALRARGMSTTDESLIRRMYATRVSPAAAMVPDGR